MLVGGSRRVEGNNGEEYRWWSSVLLDSKSDKTLRSIRSSI